MSSPTNTSAGTSVNSPILASAPVPAGLHRVFTSDNTAPAAEQIVTAVAAAATGPALPYGADPWTQRAQSRLREVFECDLDVLPTATGSAANALALAALCPPWGSVLCHAGSHITTDECGAPEFFTAGAKLVGVPGADAKIDPEQLATAARRKAGDVHSVQPSALSITQATETGTVYTVAEVTVLAGIAKSAGLGVHMDGARFANAVTALGVSPAEMTWRAGVDVLSFGSTKNGAMTADAVVVFDRSLTAQLAFRAKRAGQLTSKMRFQSAQLDAYLHEDLWLDNATHANAMATDLGQGLAGIAGVELVNRVEANIVFARLPQPVIEGLLARGFAFYFDRWEPGVVRFVTSFATTAEDVRDLLDSVRQLISP